MADGPIGFCKELIPAVMDGSKTHTRRIVRPQPPEHWNQVRPIHGTNGAGVIGWRFENKDDPNFGGYLKKIPYQVGDKRWVREGYQVYHDSHPDITKIKERGIFGCYLAGNKKFGIQITKSEYKKWKTRKYPYRKTSGRFMYKSLTRTWLEVVKVWYERLQDISVEDILAEGLESFGWDYADSPDGANTKFMYWADVSRDMPAWCPNGATTCECIEDVFSWLWDSLHKKPGDKWVDNPWIRAVEFKVVKP